MTNLFFIVIVYSMHFLYNYPMSNQLGKFLQYIATRDDLKQNMPEIKGNFEQNKKLISSSTLKEQKAICEKGMQELDNLNKMFGPKEATAKK